jgi:dsDNA-binding SOS-regulon protein
MGPPRCVKDVQKLTGEKGLPFFKLLKKTGKFEWTEEAKEAFESLKAYLTSSPVLTPPKKHEDMMLYIAENSMVVIAAIVVERGRRTRVQSTAASLLHQ